MFCLSSQVDAALDLSHTQNIGRMIRTHFPYSQFIVVSLKEGMFSNANVIFRTKFVDGVSAVTRTVNKSRCAGGACAARCWLPVQQDGAPGARALPETPCCPHAAYFQLLLRHVCLTR